MRDKWIKKIKAFWKGWGYTLLISILIATSFKSVIADWNIVPTGSMNPTILEGDRIFVNKLAYDLKIPYTTWHVAQWNDPRRGQIAVFYSPRDGRRMVKRVIGTPGDTIAMRNNRLFINGEAVVYEPLESDPGAMEKNAETPVLIYSEDLDGIRHPVMVMPQRPALRSFGPLQVPEGKYLMMGDNRDNSADFRYFGFVERRDIVGQATAIVISLDILNKYAPRWSRFFTRLS
ncbi:MAG: signal peptidase I [Desulfatitalea sp.]|nr:signal peptidase I [Desulfatitalea sp.]NNK00463.1 signal peptidase I [Desulfatitalea sp.]